jgi:hypothetical protein
MSPDTPEMEMMPTRRSVRRDEIARGFAKIRRPDARLIHWSGGYFAVSP